MHSMSCQINNSNIIIIDSFFNSITHMELRIRMLLLCFTLISLFTSAVVSLDPVFWTIKVKSCIFHSLDMLDNRFL